jgi:hypothetical protein
VIRHRPARTPTKAALLREIQILKERARFEQETFTERREHMRALVDLLAMLDASSFSGQKTYRCLTERELQRLAEIRKQVEP